MPQPSTTSEAPGRHGKHADLGVGGDVVGDVVCRVLAVEHVIVDGAPLDRSDLAGHDRQVRGLERVH